MCNTRNREMKIAFYKLQYCQFFSSLFLNIFSYTCLFELKAQVLWNSYIISRIVSNRCKPDCWGPASAGSRDILRMDGVSKRETEAASQSFFELPVYFKLMILFYTFTKALGQRFDILVPIDPNLFFSKNHWCPSKGVPSSVILLSTSHVSLWIHCNSC